MDKREKKIYKGDIENILYDFWNNCSDSCPLEDKEQEVQLLKFKEFLKSRLVSLSDLSQKQNIIIKPYKFEVYEVPQFGGEPQLYKIVDNYSDAVEVANCLK